MKLMFGQPVTGIGGVLAAGRGHLDQLSSEALIWSAAAIAAVILLGVVVLVVRRRALNAEARSPSSEAIDEVERLHQDGLLTDEEYRRARRAVLGLAPAQAEHADSEDPTGVEDADPDASGEDV